MSEGLEPGHGRTLPTGIDRRSLLTRALLLALGGCAGTGARQAFRASPSTPRYDIEVRLEPAQRRMIVSGTARLPGLAGGRQELRLLLSPLASEVRFSCRSRHGPVPVSVSDAPRRADREWTLRLAAPLPPGTELEVRFSYRIGGQGLLFYAGPELCFATAWGMNWYPLSLADTMGLATGSLRVEAPAGWTVVACHRPLRAPRRAAGAASSMK